MEVGPDPFLPTEAVPFPYSDFTRSNGPTSTEGDGRWSNETPGEESR